MLVAPELPRSGAMLSGVAFQVMLASFTLIPWSIAAANDLLFAHAQSKAHMVVLGRHLARMTSFLWRLVFKFAWWLEVDTRDLAPLETAGATGRRVCVLANHTSFMDNVVICAYSPFALVGDLKTLMMRKVLTFPIVGRLSRAIGHLPVPFKSEVHGKFDVDKEEMAAIIQRLDEHIDAGGHLAIFPEGGINLQPRNLQQFRAGGLETCIRHDMEVWGWVMTGNWVSWPFGSPLGGFPARLSSRSFLIHTSAKDASQMLAPNKGIQEQARALATDCREAMQRVLDEMLVKETRAGYAAPPVTPGEKL